MPAADPEVIVFDGQCVLCSRSVHFIMERDPQRRFRFATMQSGSGRKLLRDHGLDPEDPVSLLLFDGTRPWTDSEAVLRIATRLGGGWGLVRVARIVPRALRDRMYRAFARRRFRWFGRRATCMLPSPGNADRFLR